jgi:serine/threonine protein kinase
LLEYDFDPESSLHRISLPLLAFTLADLVATVSAQDARVIARSVAYQASSALTYLHERDIAHRDVNPKNIMFDWDGVLKLVDFSTAFAPSVCHTGEQADEMVCQVGTGCVHVSTWPCDSLVLHRELTFSSYRAPELLFGTYSYRAPALDLWGLGACLADIFRGLGPLFDASFGDIGLSASIFRIRGHPSLSWPASTASHVGNHY